MVRLRDILLTNRKAAALLLALTLLVKAVIPAGYMVSSTDLVLTVTVCADSTGEHVTRQIVVPKKAGAGTAGHGDKGSCPFGALAMGTAGGPAPWLLAIAIAFILALGFAPARIPERKATPRLRPPLRGPPRPA